MPLLTLLVCHAAHGGRGHVLDVLEEGAARGLERRSHPGSASSRQLLLGEVHRERALLCVYDDAVAVLEQADRTTNLDQKRTGMSQCNDRTIMQDSHLCFRRDVTDNKAV